MLRVKRPTKKTNVVGNFDLNPSKVVGEYLTSKEQSKYYVKPPSWDTPGDSIELRLIENTRENNAMMKLQAEMLENNKRQAKANTQRMHQMNAMQDRLRKNFIEVTNFLKDCADKKRIAEKEVKTEHMLHLQLREDMKKFNQDRNKLKTFRDTFKEVVNEYEPYVTVLNDVTKMSQIYSSVKDCTGRCDALMLAQVEITKLKQLKMAEIEKMRKTMIKLTNEAALTVLGLKNDLAKLERSYNVALSTSLKWEKILANAKETLALNDLAIENTYGALNILYSLLMRRRDKNVMVSRSQPLKAMEVIKYEIEILNQTLRSVCSNSNEHTKIDASDAKIPC